MVSRAAIRQALAAAVSLFSLGALAFEAIPQEPDPGFPGFGGRVFAILQHNDLIYVGGSFSTAGDVARNNLAAIDVRTGAVVAEWNPDLNGPVRTLAVGDGCIFAGGEFTTAQGGTLPRRGLASFTLADRPFSTLPLSIPCQGWIRKLLLHGDKLYATGEFSLLDEAGHSRLGLMAIDPETGQVDPAWNPSLFGGGFDMKEYGAKLYVVGPIQWLDGGPIPQRGGVAFNLADGIDVGVADPLWNPPMTGFPSCIEIVGERAYLAGSFSVGGEASPRRFGPFAFSLTDGALDVAWDSGQTNDLVYAMAVVGDRLIVGGDFTRVNGTANRGRVASYRLAEHGGTGVADPWNPDAAGTAVYALTRSGMGGLLVGGLFSTVGGAPAASFAAFGAAPDKPINRVSPGDALAYP